MLFEEMSVEEIVAVRSEEAREEGREKGREEGLETGREKGLTEASFNIARNLLAKGSVPEFISETTGLSMDEIAKLQQG